MTEAGPQQNQGATPAQPTPGQAPQSPKQPVPAAGKNVFDWLAGVKDNLRTGEPPVAGGAGPRIQRPSAQGQSALAAGDGQGGLPSLPRPAGWGATAGASNWNPNRRGRRARLRLARIDPWSVMKTFFLFAVAGALMNWVATYVVWSVLDATGMFEAINKAARDILASPTESNNFDVKAYLSRELVLGITAIVGAVNVVIFTTLATIAAFLYNLSAGMLGGLEVTLAED